LNRAADWLRPALPIWFHWATSRQEGGRGGEGRTGKSGGQGPGAEPLVGGQGGEAPLKLKAFCTFLHKKWPKVKDLSENLPPPVSELRRHGQP